MKSEVERLKEGREGVSPDLKRMGSCLTEIRNFQQQCVISQINKHRKPHREPILVKHHTNV